MSATVLRAARSAPPATEVRVLPSLTVELHDATPTDAPVIAAIYNASLRSLPYQATPEGATQGAHWLASELRALGDSAQAPRGNHLGPWSVRMMAEWIAMHERAGRRLWLALVDGEPVGWLSFLGFCDRARLKWPSMWRRAGTGAASGASCWSRPCSPRRNGASIA